MVDDGKQRERAARERGKTQREIHEGFHSRANPMENCNVAECKQATKEARRG